jgi:NitT/TauT family transport system substrate-binding protein
MIVNNKGVGTLRKKSLLAAFAVGAFALAGCATEAETTAGGSTDESTSATEVAPEDLFELTLAHANPSCIIFFPAYVADTQGFFADEGLAVNIEGLNGSGAVLQAMAAGQADLGSPGAAPTMLAQAAGQDIKYIANTAPGGLFQLVVPESSGITDASGLDGATIGIATADGNERNIAAAILAAEGVTDFDTLVVGEGATALAGFERGDIDAYAASLDTVAYIENAGVPLTNVTGTATAYLFGNGLAANADFIADNPEVVAAFIRAYERAVEASLADFEVVIQGCEAYSPQEAEDRGLSEALFNAMKDSLISPDGDVFGFNNAAYWELVKRDLIEAGEAVEGIDVNNVFTNDYLPSS